MPSLRRVMEPTWTYDSLTTLTGGHTPPQLGQRGGWNGVRHGHRGIITHHKWPQVFRVTAVLDKSGFAWDVFGNAKTSVRGGFGMFYDILKAEDSLQFNGQAPFFASGYLSFSAPANGFTSDPGIMTDPYGAAGATNPFPSKPVNHNVNFADAGLLPLGGGNPFYVDPNLKTPRIYQFNLSLQQQFANNLTLEAGYVG